MVADTVLKPVAVLRITLLQLSSHLTHLITSKIRKSQVYIYLIKNSQAVKKGAAPIKAMVKKDVKSKVAAKKWL